MSVSFQVEAERVNVDIESGKVIVSGVDMDELVGELNTEEILDALEFTDVAEYYIRVRAEDADE